MSQESWLPSGDASLLSCCATLLSFSSRLHRRRQVMLTGAVGHNQSGSVSARPARAKYFPMRGRGGRMQKKKNPYVLLGLFCLHHLLAFNLFIPRFWSRRFFLKKGLKLPNDRGKEKSVRRRRRTRLEEEECQNNKRRK